MGLSEVSAGAYATCVERRECGDEQITSCAAASYKAENRQNYPMNCVDFRQADAFCRARGPGTDNSGALRRMS